MARQEVLSAFELDPETMTWTKTGEIAGGDGDQIFGLVISMSGQISRHQCARFRHGTRYSPRGQSGFRNR